MQENKGGTVLDNETTAGGHFTVIIVCFTNMLYIYTCTEILVDILDYP